MPTRSSTSSSGLTSLDATFPMTVRGGRSVEALNEAWVADALQQARVARLDAQYRERAPEGAVYRIAMDDVRSWRPVG